MYWWQGNPSPPIKRTLWLPVSFVLIGFCHQLGGRGKIWIIMVKQTERSEIKEALCRYRRHWSESGLDTSIQRHSSFKEGNGSALPSGYLISYLFSWWTPRAFHFLPSWSQDLRVQAWDFEPPATCKSHPQQPRNIVLSNESLEV